MFGISMWELLVVGLILFLVVGPAKLPGLAKSIGQGIRDLRRNLNDIKGSVDKDDEFVKAVKEARQSVAEAREAVRSIFDDVEDDPERAPTTSLDPNPKPSPRGRPLVRAGRGEGPGPGAPAAEGQGPTLDDAPVEAEVWRADALEAPRTSEAGAEGPGTAPPPAAEDAPPTTAEAPVQPAPAAPAPEAAGVPSEIAPRGRTGRRMVRPGKPRPQGGGSPPGSA